MSFSVPKNKYLDFDSAYGVAAILHSGEGRESETRAAGTVVAADNGYDRSTFAAGDKIVSVLVIHSGGLHLERRFFRHTGESKPSVTGTELSLVRSHLPSRLSNTVIRAPTSERREVRTPPEICWRLTIGHDGTLSFTGESAFVHKA